MNSYEKSLAKASAIALSIKEIKIREYNLLGYNIDRWELSFELHLQNVLFSEYSRIYLFNNQVDVVVNKILAEKYKLVSDYELENGITSDLRAFLVLKYPYSQVPELDDTYFADNPLIFPSTK